MFSPNFPLFDPFGAEKNTVLRFLCAADYPAVLPGRNASIRGAKIEDGLVAGAGGHQVFNRLDSADAAACAGKHAVDGGGGAREVELALQGPLLQQSINEAGVEDVACAG